MTRGAALLLLACSCAAPAAAPSGGGELPGLYYTMLQAGTDGLATRIETEGIQKNTGAVLAGAVLYTSAHPANPCRGDRARLELALRGGDLLAAESEAGRMTPWLNHRWLIAPWIDGMRLLDRELGDERRARWRRELEKNLADLAVDVADRADFPRYQSPFIRTSPNHLSIWASTLHFGGKVLGHADWEALGARVMHRFAAREQTADGYWGEHSDSGPTTGYNFLTTTSVAFYWENSRDPAALEALRRALDFHEHFTWPDGTPVEVVNDRNRHGGPSAWGHFGFSNFPDGRRYAEFLTGFLKGAPPRGESLNRVAQDALYFHEGPTAPIPRDQAAWVHRMKVPGAMRKSGPWWIGLSALVSTQAVRNQFYLDRQGHLSLYHEKAGLIVNGANSKRQPELATFSEKIQGQVYPLPISSALETGERQDRLSLAYNSFWADLRVEAVSPSRVEIVVSIVEQGRVEEASLNLQLRIAHDVAFETGQGKIGPGLDPVEIADVGGRVKQGPWTLTVDSPARLAWPVYPFNPYSNGPETDPKQAVATLSVPLKPQPHGRLRTQEIRLSLEVE
jgi:hypothetical protein